MEWSDCMKIGVMQPYFFPYIGYWQLMNVVDKYVIFDDVNYINKGWINRNRILINGQPNFFTIPLVGASQNKLINEIEINKNDKGYLKILRTIEMAYKKAPFFPEVFELFEGVIQCDENNLAKYLKNSIEVVSKYLDINTELLLSSEIEKDCTLKGQEKILEICKKLGGTEYYNAIGGVELYSQDLFRSNGINLSFVKTNNIEYKQYENEFCPGLSILDVMMFNSPEKIRAFLDDFELIT